MRNALDAHVTVLGSRWWPGSWLEAYSLFQVKAFDGSLKSVCKYFLHSNVDVLY